MSSNSRLTNTQIGRGGAESTHASAPPRFGDTYRVLVVRLRHLGDVLLTTPVFEAFKHAHPGGRAAGCVNAGTEEMLRGNPSVETIIPVAKARGIAAVRAMFQTVRSIRTFGPDVVLDLTGSDRSAVLSWFSGAKVRAAWFGGKGFLGKSKLYTHRLTPRNDRHVVAQHLELLRMVGTPSMEPPLRYVFTEADSKKVEEMLGAARGRIVQIHPISRIRKKCWPDPHMAGLIDHLSLRGLLPVVTGSNDPVEVELLNGLLKLTRQPVLNLAGKLSLKELGALSAVAECYVGIDSGPMHIAAAVGTPVAALFGPSTETMWRPWSKNHLVISRDLSCRLPCKNKRACPHIECMNQMEPSFVLPQLDRFLDALPNLALPPAVSI